MKNAKTSLGIEENIEGLLCYLLVWISGIVFILIEKDNKFVRFHAFQSTIVFLALTVISFVLNVIPVFGSLMSALIGILVLILWVFLMYKAYNGEKFRMPVAGDLAEKYSGM